MSGMLRGGSSERIDLIDSIVRPAQMSSGGCLGLSVDPSVASVRSNCRGLLRNDDVVDASMARLVTVNTYTLFTGLTEDRRRRHDENEKRESRREVDRTYASPKGEERCRYDCLRQQRLHDTKLFKTSLGYFPPRFCLRLLCWKCTCKLTEAHQVVGSSLPSPKGGAVPRRMRALPRPTHDFEAQVPTILRVRFTSCLFCFRAAAKEWCTTHPVPPDGCGRSEGCESKPIHQLNQAF